LKATYLLPDGTDDRFAPALERFMARVVPEPNTGCWLWLGAPCSQGYGRFRIGGKNERPHRAAWLLFVGEIPDGLEVCHACDLPACVNLAHLHLGTHAQNMAEMAARNRSASGARNAHARLTLAAVDWICSSPDHAAVVAAQFGVHEQHVRAIRRGRFWRTRPSSRAAAPRTRRRDADEPQDQVDRHHRPPPPAPRPRRHHHRPQAVDEGRPPLPPRRRRRRRAARLPKGDLTMPEQTPTEGRFVRYMVPALGPRSAVITHVYPSRPETPARVDLTILHRGYFGFAEQVPYSPAPAGAAPEEGTWHWPPFVPAKKTGSELAAEVFAPERPR
jgi:hypothetical protein